MYGKLYVAPYPPGLRPPSVRDAGFHLALECVVGGHEDVYWGHHTNVKTPRWFSTAGVHTTAEYDAAQGTTCWTR